MRECAPFMVFNMVTGLPAEPMPHNIYFVLTSANTVAMYVTSKDGKTYLVGTQGGQLTLTSPNGTITITNGNEIDVAQSVLDTIISLHNSFPDLQGGQPGQRYHLDLEQYNYLTSLSDNRLVQVGNIEQSGLTVTLEDVIWIINGTTYSDDSQLFNIQEATDGNYRIDIVVGNNSGQLILIQGTESETNPVEPAIPANTILVTRINVFGDTISVTPDPEIPNLQEVMDNGSIGIVNKPISIINADFDTETVLGIESFPNIALILYKQTPGGSAGIEFRVGQQGITVYDDESYVGLQGAAYYGANATSNTYVQKKYVEDGYIKIDPSPAVTQEGQGRLYFSDGFQTGGTSSTYPYSNIVPGGVSTASGADTYAQLSASGLTVQAPTKGFQINNPIGNVYSLMNAPDASGTIALESYVDGYDKTITVGTGGNYTTLEDLFDNEPAGKTLILLTDAAYNCANPKFVIKEGWIIGGQGIGKTRITFTFNTTIDPDTSGLHIRQTCKLEDLEVITVNDVASGGLGQYALHADYSTYSDFKAEINRCSFRTVLSAQSADLNGFNGLTVGIGTWEGQTIEFHDCFIEGAYVTYSDKYTLNVHNKYTASTHIIPSRVSYYNCLMTGGFTTVLISDSYSNDAEPNQDRVQDLYEFINCDISSLWLRSHSQLGTIDKKNGILYNFTGSKVREFLNTSEVVDSSLSNYTIKSLPVTEDVEYLKNIGATTINAGDFVSYVYANRLPEYHLTSEKTINTIIGIEKLTSTNRNNFAGIALATSAVGNFNHFAKGAIAYTSLTSTTINIGDNVTFDASGNLIRANYHGVGTVVKKTYDNRLGVELHPSGKKTNVIGSDSWRGVVEVEGKVGVVGPPTIRMTDNNSTDGYGWQFTNGTNANSGGGTELGRFAISDLEVGVERFGISAVGDAKITGRSLSVQNLDVDSDPNSTFFLGSITKPGYFKMVNAYNSGNGFEIYQDPATGRASINPNSSILSIAIQPSGNVSIGTTTDSGGAKLQVNGRTSGSNAVNDADYVTLGQLNGVGVNYVAKTANYSLVYADGVVDFTSGSNNATLPTAVGIAGKRFFIKNSGAGVTTVATTSSQTIDGLSNYLLSRQHTSILLVSDGANWKILSVFGNAIATAASSATTVVVNPVTATSYRLNPGVTSVTLPTLTGNAGIILFFVNNTGGNVALNSNAGGNDIWSGGSSTASDTIPQDTVLRILHDGTQWSIL